MASIIKSELVSLEYTEVTLLEVLPYSQSIEEILCNNFWANQRSLTKDYTISITGWFDYIQRRKQLEKRYRHLIPYSRQFITNEIV